MKSERFCSRWVITMTLCKYVLSNWSRQNLDIYTADGVVVIALD